MCCQWGTFMFRVMKNAECEADYRKHFTVSSVILTYQKADDFNDSDFPSITTPHWLFSVTFRFLLFCQF